MPDRTVTSKISSTPVVNSNVASVRPVESSMTPMPQRSSSRFSAMGTPPKVEVSRILDKADEGQVAGEWPGHGRSRERRRRFSSGLKWDQRPLFVRGRNRVTISVRVELAENEAWRNRGQQFDCADVDQAAGFDFVRPPAAGGIGFGHCGHVFRLTVDQGEAVQVAATLRRQSGNERWPPTRHKTKIGMQRT